MGMVEDRIDMPVEHMKNVFGQFDTFMKKVEKAFHITVRASGTVQERKRNYGTKCRLCYWHDNGREKFRIIGNR